MEVEPSPGDQRAEFAARPYQVELLQKCLASNSIVYLGTGSGKTFIATMMIKELGNDIRCLGQKSIFLVNSVPLVRQQSDFLRSHLPFRVTAFCGADNVDGFTPDRWRKEIKENQVFVLIHQVFRDLLHGGHLSWGRINLLVLDECHHTLKNSMYSQIMDDYHKWKELQSPGRTKLPRILGLSASIVTSHCNIVQFREKKEKLEAKLDSHVVTTENLASLLQFSTNPDETFVFFQNEGFRPCSSTANMVVIIQRALAELACEEVSEIETVSKMGYDFKDASVLKKDIASCAKKIKSELVDVEIAIQELGLYPTKAVLASRRDDLERKEITTDNLFQIRLIKIVTRAFTEIMSLVCAALEATSYLSPYDQIMQHCSTHVQTLIRLLDTEGRAHRSSSPILDEPDEKVVTATPQLSIVVFVVRRQTAVALSAVLAEVAAAKSSLEWLKCGFAVGGGAVAWMKSKAARKKDYQDALEAAARERERLDATLKSFRSGTLNCIVSTQVLEEGMDVKKCNLVIRFDDIPEFRSYVQSKGRARAKPSKFIMMADANKKADIKAKINSYREIESDSLKECHNLVDLSEDTDDNDGDEVETYYADLSNPMSSPKVTSLSAVGLIHHYVATRPTDRYTKLSPFWEMRSVPSVNPGTLLMRGLQGIGNSTSAASKNEDGSMHQCLLHLPHLTRVYEPVKGEAKLGKKSAKRSAALRAVKILHRLGELDEHLRPKKIKLSVDDHGEEDEEDIKGGLLPKAGTKRRKRYYKNQLPNELRLKDNFGDLQGHREAWLYQIVPIMEEEIQDNQKQYAIRRPENNNRKVGFLVSQSLGQVPTFSLHTVSGKNQVLVEYCDRILITEGELKKLSEFVQFAYGPESLNIIPEWYNASPTTSHGYAIAPVTEHKIDWEFVEFILSPLSRGTKSPKSLLNCVVSPRQDPEEKLFIEEVIHSMSPGSTMPHNKKQTFAENYLTKFGLVVSDMSQPLLRKSNALKRHNMLYPIGADLSKSASCTAKRQERLNTEFRLVIPELLIVHKIPADFWQELQIFPFAMSRVSQLIRLREFETMLGNETSLAENPTSGNSLSMTVFQSTLSSNQLFQSLLTFDDGSVASKKLPPTVKLMESLTMAGAGEIFDLERLEILGDSFLKYASSLFVFIKEDTICNEGGLTQKRTNILSNKNLFKLAHAKELERYVTSQKLEPHFMWTPPRLAAQDNVEDVLIAWDQEIRKSNKCKNSYTLLDIVTSGEVSELLKKGEDILEAEKSRFIRDAEERKKISDSPEGERAKFVGLKPRQSRMISDKSLADVVESIIGCFLMQGGHQSALCVMSWFGMDLDFPKTNESGWLKPPKNAFVESVVANSNQLVINQRFAFLMKKVDAQAIEAIIGYQFRDRSFLLESLTHCSYSQNRITNAYERLEFLGDAVIDYLVTCYLVSNFPRKSPGQITDLRMALVNNNTLGRAIVQRKLHQHLLYHSPRMLSKIDEFVSLIEDSDGFSADSGAKFRDNLDLFSEETCPYLENVEVPKVLGDLLESLAGAVFLDSGLDLNSVWKMLRRILPEMDDIISLNPTNHVKQVMERFPTKVKFSALAPTESGKANYLAMIDIGGQTYKFRGIGNRNKLAKEAAAKCAKRELKKRNLWS